MTDHGWILCVDDDETLLSGIELQLSLDYEVRTAVGGHDGLELLDQHPDCSVIISDMRMPGMNGAEFLARAREVVPETTRMLLTGYSELDAAIRAVNEGGVFRFMTKPTAPDDLKRAVADGIGQWQLIRSERLLLEQTVRGAAESLVEALEIASPLAFSRARAMEDGCRHVATVLRIAPTWPISLAGLFLRLGWISIPEQLIESKLAGHPLAPGDEPLFGEALATSVRLVGRIPRLEEVAEIIAATWAPSGWLDGGTIVAAVAEFDDLRAQGRSPAEARHLLERRYPEEILDALGSWPGADEAMRIKEAEISQLIAGMVAQEDVLALGGQLLVRSGSELTETLVERIRNYHRKQGVVEPVTVAIRMTAAARAAKKSAEHRP